VRRGYSSPGYTGSTSTLSCAVLPLDFSSVGCTGSRHASGHCVSRRDYSSSGMHRLYCAYVVHPDAPSRRLTSRWSVALALVARPVTAFHGATTHRPYCTGSTTPMPCIRRHRLHAQLLVSWSHWLTCVPGHFVVHRDYPSRDRNRYTFPRAARRQLLAARPGASAHRTARHGAGRRPLRLRRASGCLDMSRGSSHGSSSTTLPRVARRRLLAALQGALARLAARCCLLHLRRAFECLGMSRGSSRGSSSTTPCVATLSCSHIGSTSATPCVATTCLAARLALLRVRRALP
jgi:hypothetical protein